MGKHIIHILTGPTAVGKTALALDWAEQNDAEIVSCDSLLFYQGMDIGTAKPTEEERSRIAHHCIDIVKPDERFDVARFIGCAKAATDDVLGRGKKVLVTGGSGFYLKAFLSPVVDQITIPEEVHTEVDRIYEEGGLESVVARLQQCSPDDFDGIDLRNPRRAVPALKRCLATGLSVNALKKRIEKADFPFKAYHKEVVVLERSDGELRERIQKRTRMMMERGLVDEVEQLLARGLQRNSSAASAIGYREVIASLNGEINPSELTELIMANTWKLVKKQRKWFRTQIQVDRVLDLSGESPPVDRLFQAAGK